MLSQRMKNSIKTEITRLESQETKLLEQAGFLNVKIAGIREDILRLQEHIAEDK